MVKNGMQSKLDLLQKGISPTKDLENSPNGEEIKIKFSFKYYKQIDYFGLDECASKWYFSFLQKLADVSDKTHEELELNGKTTEYRYHPIDWNQKNIPIKRNNLDWIPKYILNNPDEYEFYQISISKANGRIVGFWGQDSSTFYILLLDPKHNIQPSKDYNYRVRNTHSEITLYDELRAKVDCVLSFPCTKNCKPCNTLKEVINNPPYIVYIELQQEDEKSLVELSEKHSFKEIFENGILTTMELDENGT